MRCRANGRWRSASSASTVRTGSLANGASVEADRPSRDSVSTRPATFTAATLEGWNVLYLRPDLPAADIADAARTAGVRVVAVSIVYAEDGSRVLGEARTLRSRLPAEMVTIRVGFPPPRKSLRGAFRHRRPSRGPAPGWRS